MKNLENATTKSVKAQVQEALQTATSKDVKVIWLFKVAAFDQENATNAKLKELDTETVLFASFRFKNDENEKFEKPTREEYAPSIQALTDAGFNVTKLQSEGAKSFAYLVQFNTKKETLSKAAKSEFIDLEKETSMSLEQLKLQPAAKVAKTKVEAETTENVETAQA